MNTSSDAMAAAARALAQARHVVVFSGAGISAESGIPTFRDAEGLWSRFAPEEFATWPGLLKTTATRPRAAAEFLVEVLDPIVRAAPNAAHRALAQMQRYTQVSIVTQNIDGLHQEAGSRVVHEVHGSLFQIVNLRGRPLKRISRRELQEVVEELRRGLEGRLSFVGLLRAVRPIFSLGPRGACRPNVVLFGQAMAEPDWTLAQEAVRRCDCLLSVGTSETVWPAAGLLDEARSAGATIIRVDPSPGECDWHLAGPAAPVVPQLVERAFGSRQ